MDIISTMAQKLLDSMYTLVIILTVNTGWISYKSVYKVPFTHWDTFLSFHSEKNTCLIFTFYHSLE